MDISGLGLLLPCNMTVRDDHGELLGVVGAELTFGRVIRDLLEPRSVRGAEASYLVDDDGQIVVSTMDRGRSAMQGRDLSKGAKLESFHATPVVEAIRERRSGSMVFEGRTYAWTRLLTIDWSYIVQGRVGEELADNGS